jgi:hypothetical protein
MAQQHHCEVVPENENSCSLKNPVYFHLYKDTELHKHSEQ